MIRNVANGDAQELDLRRYLGVLRRRAALIAVVVLGLVASALALSFLQTPIYEGEARVVLQPASRTSLFGSEMTAGVDPDLLVETEIEVIKSDPVRAEVQERLGPVREVEAERVGESLMIELRGRSTNPEQAAAVTNAYATAYIEFRRRQAANEMLAVGQEIQAKISELQRQIETLDPGTETERRDLLVAQQGRFKERLDEIEVEASLESGGARPVSAASVPEAPVKPSPARNGLLAAVAGLVLGVSLAGFVEYLDDSVKTKDDLVRLTDVPLLGVVPVIVNWRTYRFPSQLVAANDPTSPAGEAYRGLRTSVQLLGIERPARSVQFTSAVPGEGKTTTVANLAVSMAATGQRVLVMDCDLRRPRLQDLFGVPNNVGISSVLAGQLSLSDAIQSAPGQDGLHVLTAGPIPPDPAELLGSRRASELVFSGKSEFDMVLIDSSPVLPVTDAVLLAGWVDATVLVVTPGVTRRKHLQGAIEMLRRVDAPLVGTVLNQATPEAGFGYPYGYQADGEGALARRRRHRSPRPGALPDPSPPMIEPPPGSPPASAQHHL